MSVANFVYILVGAIAGMARVPACLGSYNSLLRPTAKLTIQMELELWARMLVASSSSLGVSCASLVPPLWKAK